MTGMKSRYILLCLLAVWFNLTAHPTLDIRMDAIDNEIKQSASNAALYLQKGEVQRQNRGFSAARQSFEHALKHGTAQPLYWYHLAKIARDQDKISQAISLLTQAVDWQIQQTIQNNTSVLIYIELAELYTMTNQWVKAANNYLKALQLHHKIDPGIYLLASHLFTQSGEAYLSSALQVIDLGLEQHPGRLCFHKKGIELALAGRQYRSAWKRFYYLIQTHPGLSRKAQQFTQLSCNQPLIHYNKAAL